MYIGPEQLPVLLGQPPVPPATSDLTVKSLLDLQEISLLPVPPGFCWYDRPLPVPPVEGRYHRQFKSPQSKSAQIWPASTTGVSPVLLVLAGTTGRISVLLVVHFLAKLRRKDGTASTTGREGRYYRLTLAEKKFPSCSCVQVCLSSAKAKLTRAPLSPSYQLNFHPS